MGPKRSDVFGDWADAWEADYRRESRRLNMPQLLAKLQAAREWREAHRHLEWARDVSPLIEEEIRVRV